MIVDEMIVYEMIVYETITDEMIGNQCSQTERLERKTEICNIDNKLKTRKTECSIGAQILQIMLP